MPKILLNSKLCKIQLQQLSEIGKRPDLGHPKKGNTILSDIRTKNLVVKKEP